MPKVVFVGIQFYKLKFTSAKQDKNNLKKNGLEFFNLLKKSIYSNLLLIDSELFASWIHLHTKD